ncbi:DNA polymerase I [Fodinicurvata sp. EGI_FJ10296]|uniref:DNA polymerase I n=1 Tax=Fodinicurvata sp. EGI_FJ10296 TaxID=3231908 RepID=UPI00345243F4
MPTDTTSATVANGQSVPETALPAQSGRTYYLVDGSGYIFRAFHTIPMRVRKADGVPTNAVYGFCSMVMKLLADIDAEYIGVIFDASRHNFRNDIYDAYKANRDEPPEELRPQFGLIREATAAFGLASIERDGFEADDIIATFARQARERGDKVIIVSSDKDLMQLVGDGVTMMDPMKNVVIDVEQVREKFGVEPKCVVDVQALAGDSVDNIPGVPGIGIKTAAQLIAEFGDLDTLLDNAGRIKQPKRRQNLIDHAESARISRQLVRLDDTVEMPETLDDMKVPEPDAVKLIAFLDHMEFPSLVSRTKSRLATDHPALRVEEPVNDTPSEAVYTLVQDRETLDAWIAEAGYAGVIGVDTETNSLNAARADLVGISMAVRPGRACYIPVGHTDGTEGTLDFGDREGDGERIRQLPLDEVIGALKPLFEDDSVMKVGHNLKYDYQILRRHGIRLAPTDDTLLMSYVLDGGTYGHGLDELAKRLLDHTCISYVELCGKGKTAITFDKVPLDKALDYAAEDADITLRLHKLFKSRLVGERMATIYETIERPLVQVVGEMESTGIRVDRTVLETMSRDFGERLATLETEIHRLAGHPFNVGSPKQVGEVLFDEMGIQGGKKGKTGAYSTGADVLEMLAAQGHDIAARLLDWRQLSKLKSTYTDALVHDIVEPAGRVHTSFSLAATNTGRLSSNDPNLQNIPIRTEAGRKIRTAFVTEPGWKLISVDYSQIELRLVADIADIQALKDAFRQGIDIHAMTASQVFGVPLDQMTPETRRKAKAINFGIIYGISGFGLAAQLGISQGEANQFIRTYLERFGELKAWMDETRKFAREHGYVSTLFGRRCHMPGIKDPNPARRNFAERQAINAPIQGTAADIIKKAMGPLPAALAAAGLDARMLLQVHDELLLEAPADQCDRTVEIARDIMMNAATLSVPLEVEAGIGDNWAEAH